MTRSRAFGRSGWMPSSSRRNPPQHRRPMPEWLEPRNLLTFTPKLVADINQDPAALELPSLNFTGLAVAGGNAFFATSNPSTGPELWKTDGTGAGTQMVKDIF